VYKDIISQLRKSSLNDVDWIGFEEANPLMQSQISAISRQVLCQELYRLKLVFFVPTHRPRIVGLSIMDWGSAKRWFAPVYQPGNGIVRWRWEKSWRFWLCSISRITEISRRIILNMS